AELYTPSSKAYDGLPEVDYPFHDKDILVTACGRICMHRKKVNISTVLAGQRLGIKEVDDGIWLVSFMHYDLGFDAVTKGLALRVSEGAKTWTYHFTSPKDDKRARIKLGSYPATSLARARTLALEVKGYVDERKDPRDVLAAQHGSAMTVADLIGSYLA